MILPVHVQPIHDETSQNISDKDGTGQPIPRLEGRLVKLIRLVRVPRVRYLILFYGNKSDEGTYQDRTVDETRASECGNQNQAVDELERAAGLSCLV